MDLKDSTIKVTNETKRRLENLKIHKRESYNEVVQRMLSIVNMLKINPGQARHRLEEIERVKLQLSRK